MALGGLIESFFVYLGFEVSTHELEEWFHHVHEAEAIAAGLGAALLATTGAMFAFVTEVTEGTAELKEFADINNLNIAELQKWMFAASVSGSTADAMKQSMASLNNTMGALSVGLRTRAGKAFETLGLKVKDAHGEMKGVSEMFTEILTKVASKGAAGTGILRRLGLDPSLIILARKGKEGIAELLTEAQSYGTTSDENAEKAVALKEAWVRLNWVGKKVAGMIAINLIPSVIGVVDKMREWIAENKKLIQSSIVTTLKLVNAVVTTLWFYISKFLQVLIAVVQWVFHWRAVSILLLSTLAAIVSYGIIEFMVNFYNSVMKAFVAMLKLDAASSALPLLIGLLAAAVFLLTDDLINFYKGNDSLIGQLQKKYPHAVGIAIGVLAALGLALGYVADLMIGSMVKATLAAVYQLGFFIGSIVEATIAMWNLAVANIAATWEFLLIALAVVALIVAGYELWKHWDQITSWLKEKWQGVREELEGIWELIKQMSVKDRIRFGFDQLTGNYGDAALTASKYDSAFTKSSGMTAVTNSPFFSSQGGSHTTWNVNIPITTTDPMEAGRQVQDGLTELHRTTTRNGQSALSH